MYLETITATTGVAPETARAVESASSRRRRPHSPAPFEFTAAVVGLGYVGLPTALGLHGGGAAVLGIDLSLPRREAIRDGRVDLLSSDRVRLEHALDVGGLVVTDDESRLSRAAAVIICVPTPIDEHRTPDLEPLRAACSTVVRTAVRGQLIILTSTTYVGCTRDLLLTPLEARGLRVGRDVHVAFSPERIDPGNDRFAHQDVPRVVGGATPECLRAASTMLSHLSESVHTLDSLESAEMTKLLENTFRAVNIALANEFAEACSALDLPIADIIEAAATKPYGFMAFYPGPGVGGHCIPCDPHYLLWQLRSENISLPLIEQAMSDIAGRPRRAVERVREILADRGRSLAGARILIEGVSYKPDVADLRESPALEVLHRLSDAGAVVGYHDPRFGALAMRGGGVLTGVAEPSAFEADLVLLHTIHSDADLSWLADAPAVLDTTYRGPDLPQRILL